MTRNVGGASPAVQGGEDVNASPSLLLLRRFRMNMEDRPLIRAQLRVLGSDLASVSDEAAAQILAGLDELTLDEFAVGYEIERQNEVQRPCGF